MNQCPLCGFRFRDARKESTYKVDGTKRVCPSQQGLRFRAWPIYAGFTHCLMIICKYLRLSHKPDYQRSELDTYQFVSLFQWFKSVFVMTQRKQLNLWETQFVMFKPLSYCFEERLRFDVKASFASRPVSRLISWYINQVI